MSNSIYTAPVYKLEELNNLFIELTAKVCNQKCAKCYIEFPTFKKIKDFISLDNFISNNASIHLMLLLNNSI